MLASLGSMHLGWIFYGHAYYEESSHKLFLVNA